MADSSGGRGAPGRHGPGVPVSAPAGQAALTAEQVWRTGRLPVPPRRRRRLHPVASGADRDLAGCRRGGAVPAVVPRTIAGDRYCHPAARHERVCGGCDRADRDQRLGRDGVLSVAVPAAGPGAGAVSRSVVAGQDAVYLTSRCRARAVAAPHGRSLCRCWAPGTGLRWRMWSAADGCWVGSGEAGVMSGCAGRAGGAERGGL
jgi:hypothetical protein